MAWMTRNIIGLGLVLALCLHGRPLSAEESPSAWYISPVAGFSLFHSGEGIANRPVYGFGVGKRFADQWRFEGGLTYLDSKLRGRDKSDLEVYQLALSLLYEFTPSKRLVPYLVVGGGAHHADPDAFGAKSGASLHVGAGLRYGLNSRLFLKGEVRHQTFFGMVDDAGERKTAHNLTTLMGLDVHFSQGPASVAAAPADHGQKVEEVLVGKALPITTDLLGRDTQPPTVSVDRLSDEELRRVDAAPFTETEKTALRPLVEPVPSNPERKVSPRFAQGTEEFLDWAPDDSQMIGDWVAEQPSGQFLLVADVDEGLLTFVQFKLLEKRMLRLRLALMERFGLMSDSVEVLSPGALPRRLQALGPSALVIRVRPLEENF